MNKRANSDEAKVVSTNIQRARRAGTPATLTLVEWQETLADFGWKCAYCGGKYEVLEHFRPISAGGGTTANNCVPSCQHCNLKKREREPDSFMNLGPPFPWEVVDRSELIDRKAMWEVYRYLRMKPGEPIPEVEYIDHDNSEIRAKIIEEHYRKEREEAQIRRANMDPEDIFTAEDYRQAIADLVHSYTKSGQRWF